MKPARRARSAPHALIAARAAPFALNLLAFSLICAILYFGRDVLVPLAMTILLTFLLSPIVRRLEMWRIPSAAGSALAVVFAGSIVGLLLWMMGVQVVALAGDLPKYRENIVDKVSDVRAAARGGAVEKIQETIDEVSSDVESLERERQRRAPPFIGPPRPDPLQPAAPEPDTAEDVAEDAAEEERAIPVKPVADEFTFSMFGLDFPSDFAPAGEATAKLGLVIVLSFFMLLRRRDLRNRMVSLAGRSNVAATTHALNEAGRRISRYLLMQLLINITYGIAAGTGLYFLGVPYAPLWGLTAAALRYLPYIGPWLAALMPIGVTLITMSGWVQVISVIGLFIVLELITNNLAEPRLYGQSVGVSEVAILVGAVAWTYLWGPLGLVLATPMTVCLVVLSNHIPAMAFLGRLIGDVDSLEPHLLFYQRLLSQDRREAEELLAKRARDSSPAEACDAVIVPTLKLACRDLRAGRLEESEVAFVTTTIRGFSTTIAEAETRSRWHAEGASKNPPHPPDRGTVIGYATDDGAEHAALFVCEALVRPDGCRFHIMPPRALSSELAAAIEERNPLAVLLVSLVPGDLARARSVLKRLRSSFPEARLALARLGGASLSESAIDDLEEAGANTVLDSIAATRHYLRTLLQMG